MSEREKQLELAKAKLKLRQQASRQPSPKGNWQQNVFPTATQIQPGGLGRGVARVGMGTLDFLDVAKRFGGTLRGQDMADPESGFFVPEFDKLANVAKQVNQEADKMLQGIKASGRELNQKEMDRYIKMKAITPEALKAIGQGVSDPLLVAGFLKKAIGEPVKKALKKTVEWPRKAGGAVARGMTKIPEETLLKYADPMGKKELAKAYGREVPTAQALVRDVYKKAIPEETQVREFIKQAEDIPLDNVINTLQDAKKSIQFKQTNAPAITAINKLIKDYKSKIKGRVKIVDPVTGKTRLEGGKVSAEDFRKMRIELDDVLGDVYEKEGLTQAQKAFKKARKSMKESLIDAAPAEYKELMEQYAKKVDARSDIKAVLGKSSDWKAGKKARTLLDNIERRTKTEEKMLMQKYDEVFGTNYTKRGETMAEARQISAEPAPPGGKFEATFFPKIATGWGAWASKAGLFIGWPRTSGKVLNALSGLEKAVKKGYNLPKKYVGLSNAQAIQKLTLAMKPMDDKKVEEVNKLLKKYESTEDPKVKRLIERDLNKKLRGGN